MISSQRPSGKNASASTTESTRLEITFLCCSFSATDSAFSSHCVVDIVKFSAECCACRFKRRIKELEDEEVSKKLAYRAEQLKDFADL